ncbi:hypothetical protein NQ317_009233 [Molorchus minor]|uniref:Uncharacterized protein n=1 Tax=Molorchus minor TaxID=1323400 RepID=A0ABQ9JB23_9CUCU|nr:hypothetical protein NQ317_009233 [Molorchus minor]
MLFKCIILTILSTNVLARTASTSQNSIHKDTARSEESNSYMGDLRYVYKVYQECSATELTSCLKLKLIAAIDRAARVYTEIPVFDGVTFVKDEKAVSDKEDNQEQLLDATSEQPTSAVLSGSENCCAANSPYFPDLAPYDFYLFPKSVEKVNAKSADLLNRVTLEALQHCCGQWKTRRGRLPNSALVLRARSVYYKKVCGVKKSALLTKGAEYTKVVFNELTESRAAVISEYPPTASTTAPKTLKASSDVGGNTVSTAIDGDNHTVIIPHPPPPPGQDFKSPLQYICSNENQGPRSPFLATLESIRPTLVVAEFCGRCGESYSEPPEIDLIECLYTPAVSGPVRQYATATN